MDAIINLFKQSGTASTILYLSLTAFTGVLLGKLEYKNLKLGIAGVLFTGLFFSQFGAMLNVDVLGFAREFGLIIFIYSIGIDIGPRFFSSFKSEGLKMNLLSFFIISLSFLISYLFFKFLNIPAAAITGIMCGAAFNTPALGGAQQAIVEHCGNLAAHNIQVVSMGFAIAYPFGAIGVMFAMIAVKILFRVNVQNEVDNYNNQLQSSTNKLESVTVHVTNPNLYNKKIKHIKKVIDNEIVISRIFRNENFFIPKEEDVLVEGDIVYGVASQNNIESLGIKMGKVEIGEKKEITGMLAMTHVLVTNRKVAGKTIEQIGIYRRYEANITRIFRAGIEILPSLSTTVELGDTVRIVGKRDLLNEVKTELGNSMQELAIPNTIPIFVGIFLGVILGSLPIYIPGLSFPAKLGLAGGPLIVAILLGHKGRIGKLDFYLTPGANMMLREIGIILFLASVGLISGTNFVHTLMNGGYMWMLYGAVITLVPIIIGGFVARLFKFNFFKICGLIAGSMTNPLALDYSNSLAPIQAQSTVYASVYPVTMFLRVLAAQIFLLITL